MSAEPDAPYVQARAKEILSILPMLKGCFAQVYLAVGAFEADPIAPTVNDIADYTTLTRQSVSTALRFLCKHEFVEAIEESGVTRYRACFGFYYGAETQTSVRDVKKVLTCHDDVHINNQHDSLNVQSSFNHGAETEKILTSVGVLGSNLHLLADSVSVELAERWVEWIESKPERFTMPVAYMVKQLKANPKAEPPAITRKSEKKREAHFQGLMFERLKAEGKLSGHNGDEVDR